MEINKIYNEDCKSFLNKISDKFVDLVVTSPPYYNLRDYSCWATYADHIDDVSYWFKELERVLKPGGHICWNIQENIPEPHKDGRHYHPIMPDTINIGISLGLEWEKNIVWNKKNATQLLFGSYPMPGTPIFSDMVEYILVFRKKGKLEYTKEQKEACKLTKERWFEITRNVWEIAPVQASKTFHPAAYPLELPKRCIEVMTVKDSVVLDPFTGSGTTALACKILGRNFIGCEYKKEYFDLANERLANEVDIF